MHSYQRHLKIMATVLLWFAMLLFAGTALAATVEASWRLTLGTAAVAHGTRVTLGEIAHPVGDLPAQQWERLAAIELWSAPEEQGKQHTVTTEKLTKMLRYYLGDVAALCVTSGHLVIQRGGKVIDGPELERQVVQALTSRISGLRGEVSLRDFRLPRQVFLSDRQSNIEVSVAGRFEPGRLSLQLTEMDAGGNAKRRYTGGVFLDQWLNVPCALRPINSRERLTPDAVGFKRKNAAYLRGELWDGRSFGQRVQRSVGAGEVLYQDNLEDVPLVSRGDILTLVFQGQYVRLTASAKALSDGKLGQRILVENLSSKREIAAEIRDAHTVVVR
ncbi:flagellar basal body P-ring formation chaperone FlgA [Desulfovibrio ferrophilus]|uniref:Flagella basal body P-ring formation protein FlgA n=1 Tax=Desulfovibrio ferrophilus TaxID=241368 RepID=A0A2Z6AXC6_9BACT|nr:flagellar basal body P-ring formation chaperone FlgA [Desulfovibrio ferrophilus]BBD07912.1 flagella basal body P-ring formation protein FlgA [Desulfovibrio ferrophilus]